VFAPVQFPRHALLRAFGAIRIVAAPAQKRARAAHGVFERRLVSC